MTGTRRGEEMATATKVITGAVIALAAVLLCAQPASAQIERFSGILAKTGGIGPGGLARFTITVEEYTTDEEVIRLLGLLADEGPRKLESELLGQEHGRFMTPGELGHNIGIVRSHQLEDGGRIVRFVTARPLALFESYNNTRSREHPFGVIELTLDAEGKGAGVIVVAAKITLNDENRLEVESFGLNNFQITMVEAETRD